jgi:hypothetical protein
LRGSVLNGNYWGQWITSGWKSTVAPSALSLIVSGVALWVAWRTYAYNARKDARARTQSIQDDFWLRKVVSPISIEPFLKFVTEVRATLPTADTPSAMAPSTLTAYWSVNQTRLNEFSLAFQSLELVDPALHRSVEEALLAFDDSLAAYVGALGQFLNGSATEPPNREDAGRVLTETMLKIFGLIQVHQRSLGV